MSMWSALVTHKPRRRTDSQAFFCCVQTQLSEYRVASGTQSRSEVSHSRSPHVNSSLLLFFLLAFIYFFCSSINVAQVLSWPSLSWDVRAHLHQCLHTLNTWHRFTTGKALSQNRQENSGKPGYNLALMEPKRFPPGRWAPSYWEKPKDRQRKLHPGKCLCSAVGSLDFCPANEWLFVCS